MANFKKEQVKRFIQDLSKGVADEVYDEPLDVMAHKDKKTIKRFVQDISVEIAEEVYPEENSDEITE